MASHGGVTKPNVIATLTLWHWVPELGDNTTIPYIPK